MEWLRPDIEEEFNKVNNSIKRFMKKQYPWIEDIEIDRGSFQKNKMSKSLNRIYDVSIVIDKKNLEMLQNNEEMLDSAEQQLYILFRTVINSLVTFDSREPKFISPNILPSVRDFN